MNDNLIFKLKSVTTSDSPLTLVKLLNQSADEIERLQNELQLAHSQIAVLASAKIEEEPF